MIDTASVRFNDFSCIGSVLNPFSIRISGVSTPEIRGRCEKERNLAKVVKRFVYNRVKDGNVKIYIYGKDKYFRLLGDFEVTY